MQFDAVLIAPRRTAMEEAGYWPGKTLLDYFEDCLAAAPGARAHLDHHRRWRAPRFHLGRARCAVLARGGGAAQARAGAG